MLRVNPYIFLWGLRGLHVTRNLHAFTHKTRNLPSTHDFKTWKALASAADKAKEDPARLSAATFTRRALSPDVADGDPIQVAQTPN